MPIPIRTLRHNRKVRAFTLAEVLLASSVLSIAIAAISQTVTTGQDQVYHALHELRAVSLAESMLEEVLALPYDDPEGEAAAGPDPGEASRSDFDNSDDFDGHSESLGNVIDTAGDAYPSLYDTFSRTVTATYGVVNVSEFGGDVDGLTVVVTVTDWRGLTWTVTRFVPEPTS